MDELRCRFCGSRRIIEDEESGELICLDCGAVVGRTVYSGPEWRAYGYGDRLRRERTGAPITPLLHDFGLSTIPAKRIDREKGDEFTIRCLSEIYRVSSSLGLPETVAQTAAILLRKASKKIKPSKKLSKALPTSLLHLAMKIHGVPRSARELAEHSEATASEILRCSMTLSSLLGVKEEVGGAAYISKIVRSLGLNGLVEVKANELFEQARGAGLSQGRIRRAVAAASVYLAARSLGSPVSQRRVAAAAGIGLSTLKRRLRELGELAAIKI